MVSDHFAFAAATFAKAVIDASGFDLSGTSGRGKEEQGKAIGPAGDGHAQRRVVGNERSEVGSEARHLVPAGANHSTCTWPRLGRQGASPSKRGA